MSWPGTEMEVLDPVELREEPVAAARLELPDSEEVAALVVRRLYEGLPFVVTQVYLPPQPGKRMRDEGLPVDGPGTVIGTIERFISSPVGGVGQDIVATRARRSCAPNASTTTRMEPRWNLLSPTTTRGATHTVCKCAAVPLVRHYLRTTLSLDG